MFSSLDKHDLLHRLTCSCSEVASGLQVRSCKAEFQQAAKVGFQIFLLQCLPPNFELALLPRVPE